jgi:hypothetical protein
MENNFKNGCEWYNRQSEKINKAEMLLNLNTDEDNKEMKKLKFFSGKYNKLDLKNLMNTGRKRLEMHYNKCEKCQKIKNEGENE